MHRTWTTIRYYQFMLWGLIGLGFLPPPLFGNTAEPFALGDVTLWESPFSRARDLNVAYLKSLEPERFLVRYRQFAGLTPQAQPYGGWDEGGRMLGHYLSALSMHYATTQDASIRTRLVGMIDTLSACQQALGSGYVGPIDPQVFERLATGEIDAKQFKLNQSWVPWYYMHKFLAGLLDVNAYTDIERTWDIIQDLVSWINHTTMHLNPAELQDMLNTEHGGMLEALLEVYARSKKPQHLELAQRFYYAQVLDRVINQDATVFESGHGNTKMAMLLGLARRYELCATSHDRAGIEFAWRELTNHHAYINGGITAGEYLRKRDSLDRHLQDHLTETCNTYNLLKLTRHLFQWQPRASLMDYYERALYNHILASQDPQTGMMCYRYGLYGGYFFSYSTPYDSFWCCVCTGMENHVKYNDSIYFHDANNLYVNLFIPSQLNWSERELVLQQETNYPVTGKTQLRLQLKQAQNFTIHLRYPQWAEQGCSISINGNVYQHTHKPGSYIALTRDWQDGDIIHFHLPMSLRVQAMPDNPQRVALLYGPVVLAGALGRDFWPQFGPYGHPSPHHWALPCPELPELTCIDKPLPEWIRPVPDRPLTFRTHQATSGPDITLIPLYNAHHQRFNVYWKAYTQTEWQRRAPALAAEQKRLDRLEKQSIDLVRIGHVDNEIEHGYQGFRTVWGEVQHRRWRRNLVRGWFSYRVNVQADTPQELELIFWGRSLTATECQLLVDGKTLERVSCDALPEQFYRVRYPLPPPLIKGKKHITITIKPLPGNYGTGYLCGLRVMKALLSAPGHRS